MRLCYLQTSTEHVQPQQCSNLEIVEPEAPGGPFKDAIKQF